MGFGIRGVKELIHGVGLLFARAAALFGAPRLGGLEPGAGVQPTGQGSVASELGGFARQVGEDRLRHILGRRTIASNLAQRSGIDQIEVTLNELGESLFRPALNITLKKFVVHLIT